jgi:hypothetical protein
VELDILTYLLVVVVVVVVVVGGGGGCGGAVNYCSLKWLGLVVRKWRLKSQLYKERFQR